MTITEHCVDRYMQRVYRCQNPQAAKRELEDAIKRPLFSIPLGWGMLHGCINRCGYKFLALETKPGILDTCGPRWFWHEAKKAWKEIEKCKP